MNRKKLLWLLVAVALVVGLVVPASASVPAQPARTPNVETPTGAGDDSAWEVGAEYVNWYGGGSDLYQTDDDAYWLYTVLGWFGWTKRFIYDNQWAWEQDWKASWRPGGGTESAYVDTVDLAYFSGHGGTAWDSLYGRNLVGLVFGNGGRNHDDAYLVPGDAYRAWGDGDLEWVVFSACQLLNDASRGYWANAMNGLHLILGFKTTMNDVNQGWHFGWRIGWNWTLTQAWFAATDITQPHQGKIARVVANEPCHFNDRRSSVCGDSYDWDYWYWDHQAGSEPALLVDPADLNYEMPVFNVTAASPNEGELAQLASDFGFSPNTPAPLDDQTQLYRATEDALDLSVDQQGVFYFMNGAQMWVPPTTTLALSRQPLSVTDTQQIADTFLTTRGLMPSDASFYEVVSDTLSAVDMQPIVKSTVTGQGVTRVFTDVQETISSTVATGQQAIYSRHIVYTPTASSPITFSVQGPGARLKVYVDNQGDVVGAMGGWRTVDDVGVLQTVSILTPTQVISLYEQLGDAVTLAPTPVQHDQRTVTRATVAYYEQSLGTLQSSLIPVYALDATLLDSTSGVTATTVAYVPATANLIPPLAKIASINAPDPIALGDVITLTAVDASQPLSALGYGDHLNFTLGQAPYTYTWKLATQGIIIGTGRTITYPVGLTDFLGSGKGTDAPIVIRLEVTDAAGRTSQTTQPFYFAGVMDLPTLFLPALSK